MVWAILSHILSMLFQHVIVILAEGVSLEEFEQGFDIAQKKTVTLYLSQHFTQRSALEQGEANKGDYAPI